MHKAMLECSNARARFVGWRRCRACSARCALRIRHCALCIGDCRAQQPNFMTGLLGSRSPGRHRRLEVPEQFKAVTFPQRLMSSCRSTRCSRTRRAAR